MVDAGQEKTRHQPGSCLPQMLVFRSFNLSGAAAAAIPLYAM
jgi:hypothetical protein